MLCRSVEEEVLLELLELLVPDVELALCRLQWRADQCVYALYVHLPFPPAKTELC